MTTRVSCVTLVFAFFGELAEWFKAPVLKTGDSERNRGFESHILRFGFPSKTQIKQCVSNSAVLQTAVETSPYGEVPKRLKGHPWKGCRPLIAVRGFKSLLLRHKSPDNSSGFFFAFHCAVHFACSRRKDEKSMRIAACFAKKYDISAILRTECKMKLFRSLHLLYDETEESAYAG